MQMEVGLEVQVEGEHLLLIVYWLYQFLHVPQLLVESVQPCLYLLYLQ